MPEPIDTIITRVKERSRVDTWGALTDAVIQIWEEDPTRARMDIYQNDCESSGCFMGWAGWLRNERPGVVARKLDARDGSAYFAGDLWRACFNYRSEFEPGTLEYGQGVIARFRGIRELHREEMDRTPVFIKVKARSW